MSCLFNSLDFFIGEGSFNIRQKICNYLQENKPIIEDLDTTVILGFENNDSEKYIENMRSTSVWGGAIEIQAACNIWNLRIIVRNYRDSNGSDIEFIPISSKAEKTIQIYWTGGHYEPIR